MKPIDDIIENFDWETVHDHMVRTNWTWGMGDDAHVPSIAELQESVRNTYKDMKANNYRISGTGGFTLYRSKAEYWLMFTIADWIVERRKK